MIGYCTGHRSSAIVMGAIAEGFDIPLKVTPWKRPLKGPAAFYGRDRGTLDIVRQCAVADDFYIMADNGYIGAGQYDGYYKLSRDGFQCDARGAPDEDRLAKLLDLTGQKITRKWRRETDNGHILVCPPIVEYERVHWFYHTHWLRNVTATVARMTKREIWMRYKPGSTRAPETPKSLEEDFKSCHAVITHDSNIAVEAIMAGIPVFVTGTSPAQVFGNVDLNTIEHPRMKFDRTKWLAILAANQWTLDEVRTGMANHLMTEPRVGP